MTALISFQFREQVVKETVERLEQKLYEKLVHHNQPPDFCEGSITAAAAPSESSSQCDWLISCCNCQARIVGVRYQCRYSVLGVWGPGVHSLGGGGGKLGLDTPEFLICSLLYTSECLLCVSPTADALCYGH